MFVDNTDYFLAKIGIAQERMKLVKTKEEKDKIWDKLTANIEKQKPKTFLGLVL